MSRVITILFSLALFFFTFGQLGRIALPNQPIYVYIYEVLVYVMLALFIFKYKLKPLDTKNSLITSGTYFFSWLALSLFVSFFYYSFNSNIIATLYAIRFFAYMLFFVYLMHFLKHHKALSSLYFKLILIALFLVISSSLVQYFLYPNLGNIAYLGWDPHLQRLVGLFFDPPITVSVLALFFFFLLLYVRHRKNILYVIPLVILISLIFLTYSRGGYLAFIVTIAAYGLRKLKAIHVMLIFLILIGGFLILPKGQSEGINLFRTTSIFTRTQDYEKALTVWQKNPIFGIGYNHIRDEKDKLSVEVLTEPFNPSHASASFHSSFLMILATTGVVGLVLYLWMLVEWSKVNEYARYSVLFLSVLSLTDNVLLHPFVLFLVAILMVLYSSLIHPSDI